MGIRLSSLETLPDAAIEDQLWLFEVAVANRMTQTDMLEEMNRRIAKHSLKPVSLSALNRYVMRVRDGLIKRPSIPESELSQDLGIFLP